VDFSKTLITWYQANKRDLPWRNETDAYKIWLSEIILQQTQVVQGLNYYLKFTEHFPNVSDLANASEDEVLKLWQGLGYYSRARNLHATAKTIVANHKGVFPNTFEGIKALKGVGPYTAAAIASIAYGLPHAVVDGNVYRVLSRVFGIETPIDSTLGKKQFQDLADELLNVKKPNLHNQAIMEFGARYCKPTNPDCENCIFRSNCVAFEKDKVSQLPIKTKKTKVKNRYLNYLVCIDKNKSLRVKKRADKDIWLGLYEFDLIESETELEFDALLKIKAVKELLSTKFTLAVTSIAYKHILSHQHLYARFYVLKLDSAFKKNEIVINRQNLHSLAFPRLIEKFVNDCKLEKLL
jgi:A/G-specific adenine glycosylase